MKQVPETEYEKMKEAQTLFEEFVHLAMNPDRTKFDVAVNQFREKVQQEALQRLSNRPVNA